MEAVPTCAPDAGGTPSAGLHPYVRCLTPPLRLVGWLFGLRLVSRIRVP